MFRAALGGFKRTEVIDYIEKLQNDFFAYRKANEENVRELVNRISELEGELSQLKGGDTVAVVKKDSANGVSVKAVIDGLAENMNKLFEKMLAAASQQEGGEDDIAFPENLELEADAGEEQLSEPEAEPEPEVEPEPEPEPEPADTPEPHTPPAEEDDDEERSFNEQIKKLISEYGTL